MFIFFLCIFLGKLSKSSRAGRAAWQQTWFKQSGSHGWLPKPTECYLLGLLGEFGKGKAWGWEEAVYGKNKKSVCVLSMCACVCVWTSTYITRGGVWVCGVFLTTMWTSARREAITKTKVFAVKIFRFVILTESHFCAFEIFDSVDVYLCRFLDIFLHY